MLHGISLACMPNATRTTRTYNSRKSNGCYHRQYWPWCKNRQDDTKCWCCGIVPRLFSIVTSVYDILPTLSDNINSAIVHEVDTQKLSCLPLYISQRLQNVSVDNERQCLLDHPASDYIKTLELALVGTPIGGSYHMDLTHTLPYEEGKRALGLDFPPAGYTMIGKARMANFRCAIAEVNRLQIKGAIVELGVWRGGAMIFAAAVLKESSIIRDLYLMDAFGAIGEYGSTRLMDYLAVPLENVQEHFRTFDLLDPHVHFEKGLFKDVLPAWKNLQNMQIAVLRIDGNFYDSYQDAMYYLYEMVPVGGFVIFDDILSHPNVRRCWEDFKREQGLSEELNSIDVHSAWFRKERVVKVEWKYFRPPQDSNKN
jgi:O-methyltransferase